MEPLRPRAAVVIVVIAVLVWEPTTDFLLNPLSFSLPLLFSLHIILV